MKIQQAEFDKAYIKQGIFIELLFIIISPAKQQVISALC